MLFRSNQEKLRDMRGDVLRGWAQSGLLPLLYAHVFSLDLMSNIFGMQTTQGTGPAAQAPTLPPVLTTIN